MPNMGDRFNFVAGVSIVLCLFFLSSAFYFHGNIKNKQIQFEHNKAERVKEELDLKDRLNVLQEGLDKKIETVNLLEEEKQALSHKIENLNRERESIMTSFRGELDTFKEKNAMLRRKIADLENIPIFKRIREFSESEQRAEIKSILEEAAGTIERIQTEKSGASIKLDPIVVRKEKSDRALFEEERSQTFAAGQSTAPEKLGTILTIDRNNNLVVTSLGRKDEVKEGTRLKIFKNNQHIATAEVISARYRISAATVNDMKYKYKIEDISEGDQVRSDEV